MFIKKIFHIADIHVPNASTRHEEFKTIFNKLYKIIEDEEDTKLVIICGDIYNEKRVTNPNAGIMVSDMITRLSKL